MSLCVQEFCNPQNILRILAAIPVCRNDTSLPVFVRDSHFHLVSGFGVGLVNNTSGVPEEHRSLRACLATCLLDIVTG